MAEHSWSTINGGRKTRDGERATGSREREIRSREDESTKCWKAREGCRARRHGECARSPCLKRGAAPRQWRFISGIDSVKNPKTNFMTLELLVGPRPFFDRRLSRRVNLQSSAVNRKACSERRSNFLGMGILCIAFFRFLVPVSISPTYIHT